MKAGFINTGISLGLDSQPDGYDIHEIRVEERFWWPDKTIYQFELNPITPLTYIAPDGKRYQPGKVYETDQGSVPWLIQRWIPKDRFLGYYFHDFVYLHGYIWMLAPGEATWVKRYMDRKDADIMLREMCLLDPFPASTREAWAIYIGVRLGGGKAWDREVKEPPTGLNRSGMMPSLRQA